MRERSPYVLLQELLWPNRWQSIVACVLLNRTKRTQVDKVWPAMFGRAPDPESLLKISEEESTEILKPLGLGKVRAVRLKKLADAWLKGTSFEKLPGVGNYALASDKIFYRNEVPESIKYVEWLKEKGN